MSQLLTPREFNVLASIVAFHVASVCIWYASGSGGPMPATEDWSLFVRRYWMVPASALYGLTVGYFFQRSWFAWTVVLMAGLASMGAFLHLAATRLGVRVDWGTAQGALALAVFTMLLYLPISLIGTIAGWKLGSKGRRNES